MIEAGTRWIYRGREVTILQREVNITGRGTGPWLLAVPERDAAELKRMRIEPKKGYHWTDWILEKSLEDVGTPVLEGQVVEAPRKAAPRTQKEAAAKAAAAERKKKVKTPITPKRRLRNKVTSARYKLKHPEKHGVRRWSALERAEIEAVIADTEREIEKLKEAS